MAKREGSAVKWVRKNAESDIVEMLFYEDAENEFLSFGSDCNDTESYSDSETDDHVFPPDFSPLYRPLSLPFTANVGMNLLCQFCESIVLFVEFLVLQNFISISLIRLTPTQVKS